MSGTLIDTVAERAVELGWERPAAGDHVLYVAHAVRALRTLADGGPALVPGARPLWWAYTSEARDLDPDGLCGVDPAALEGLGAEEALWLALYAPGRLGVEVALLAAGRRRTGRALKLVNACRRIQLAADRSGVGPVGRARARGAYVGDDGRARGLFVLARGGKIGGEGDRESLWPDFWGSVSGGVASARPSSRSYATREGAGATGPDLWALEGGEFGG